MGKQADQINPFWEFSLDFYARDKVSSTCLILQDNFGADVNIILYCCWLGYIGTEEIEITELDEIVAGIEAWQHHVVKPLRQIRNDIKNNEFLHLGHFSSDFLLSIKDCELESEKVEQLVLYHSGPKDFPNTIGGFKEKVDSVKINLTNYLNLITTSEKDGITKHINTLNGEIRAILGDDVD